MRTTHTFAELEVSRETYLEIYTLLAEAGYHHAFIDGAIDMKGIALRQQRRQLMEEATAGTERTPRELPRYKSHKEVQALKIALIEHTAEGGTLYPEDRSYDKIQVDHQYMAKHEPTTGGYYVVYKDGYKSFSPAEAFEDGYTLVN